MRTRWIIDFDGCVVPTLKTLIEDIGVEFGINTNFDLINDITDFWKTIPPPIIKWAWSDKVFDNRQFLDKMKPHPYVIETIHELLDMQCPVVIVTDRPRRHIAWVKEWLARYDIYVPVVSSEDRNENKVAYVSEYEITTVVEDNAATSVAYLAEASVKKLFLFTVPWNKSVYLQVPAERLDSWGDLLDRIITEKESG